MKWNNKHILVTGAAGFIGFNLLQKLINLNAEIVAIDDFSSGKSFETLSKMPIKIIRGDVSDSRCFEKVPNNIDYIFHFGAPSSIILFNKDPVLST